MTKPILDFLAALANCTSAEEGLDQQTTPAAAGTLLTFVRPRPGTQWAVGTDVPLTPEAILGAELQDVRMRRETTPFLAAAPSALGLEGLP